MQPIHNRTVLTHSVINNRIGDLTICVKVIGPIYDPGARAEAINLQKCIDSYVDYLLGRASFEGVEAVKSLDGETVTINYGGTCV